MEKENTLKFPEKAGDLFVNYCGICNSEPLESFGPAIKPHYLILYILDGNGIFTMGGKKFKLEKGEGFLIRPEELASYQADKKNPWTYAFIGFGGSNAEYIVRNIGFTIKHPIFKIKEIDETRQILEDMIENRTFDLSAELKRNGLLSFFLSIVAANTVAPKGTTDRTNDRAQYYVRKAVDFIHNNYCNPIKITDIAEYVCINRSYLYTLFMDTIDISPHQYLANHRISRACDLLKSTNISIEGIALSCGYMDSLVFTKAFKQMKNISPSSYRKTVQSNEVKGNKTSRK